jgi:glycosyltransferase involved in cell wall biosynthesis
VNTPDSLSVVQVATSDIGGGAERVASDLHRMVRRRGIDSTLAVGFRFDAAGDATLIPNDANRSAWARMVLRRVPPIRDFSAPLSPANLALRRGLKTLAEPRRAWVRARGFEDFEYPGTAMIPDIAGARADVIHLHNLHGGYFDLRQLPAISSAVPTVLTAHDTWVTSGHCAYTVDCDRWLTGCGSCPRLSVPPAIPRDRTAENWQRKRDIFRRSRVHVAAPSRWMLDQLERSVFAEAIATARVIPNGVDQDVFRPGDRATARSVVGLSADPLVVMFTTAGEGNPYKDFATIRAALPEIARRVRDRPLTVVALGTASLSESLPGAVVVSVPFVRSTEHVARYLQAADLYVHMAHGENHPLAILEAQSCGIPVIASDVGGISETLADGITGVLVPAGDAAALASAASGLLTDGARRLFLGAAAADYARGRFGLERMADAYISLYREIAESRRRQERPPA